MPKRAKHFDFSAMFKLKVTIFPQKNKRSNNNKNVSQKSILEGLKAFIQFRTMKFEFLPKVFNQKPPVL